jgi:hypothetical protein
MLYRVDWWTVTEDPNEYSPIVYRAQQTENIGNYLTIDTA